MRNWANVERDSQRGNELAVRFGGSLTGVGAAAGVLYLFGADRALTAWMSAALLLIGITLLIVGYRARQT